MRYEYTDFDEAPSRSDVVCEFDRTVRPGVVYAPEEPLTLKVLDRAPYDQLRVTVDATDTGPEDGASDPVRGTGPAVKLVERPDGTPAPSGSAQDDGWDGVDVAVTADSTAGFQVSGARLRGRVGDTVALRAKSTDVGPAWVLRRSGESATRVLIDMPAGTSVTEADDFCRRVGYGSYSCGTSESCVNEGGGDTYDFTVKIVKAVAGARGSVALGGDSGPFDHDKANDTAAITPDVTGGGTTGGSGSTSSSGGSGTGGTGGSGSTAGGSTVGGSSTGGSTSGSPTGGSTTGGASSSTGGGLANTGSGPVLPLSAGAAAAVLVGAGALVVVRRRVGRQRCPRTHGVAPTGASPPVSSRTPASGSCRRTRCRCTRA
ncbi:hypothetical protein ACIHEJ_30785 [Streptomyces sp. NPDC052301]|uniref:hypothetical protein n=1 Tax=Streptomyces sp. NPDC052301 TaxID=3365687 RepID=UPI0037CD99DD